MHLLSILLIGVATNLDNLLIGVSAGVRRKKIPWTANLLIAGIGAAACCLFAYIGLFSIRLGRWPNLIGGALLIVLGGVPLGKRINTMYHKKKRADSPDSEEAAQNAERETVIGLREALTLSGVLAANAVTVALGAGMTGLHPLLIAVSIGLFSFAAVGIGNYIGRSISVQIKGSALEIIACIALIAVGLWEMLL